MLIGWSASYIQATENMCFFETMLALLGGSFFSKCPFIRPIDQAWGKQCIVLKERLVFRLNEEKAPIC
jgi:hypothetical protein